MGTSFVALRALVREIIPNTIHTIGGELYESVGVEAPILLPYTHKH